MYSAFRTGCERVLRIPPDPDPPPGDEASTKIYRAANNYYKYLLIVWAIVSFVHLLPSLVITIVLMVLAVTSDFGPWFIIFFLLLLMSIAGAIAHLAIIRLDYEKRWYVVTDRSLRVREGVIIVREMTITFANIQNISISQGPLQRLLGIASLRVDTAGGAGAAAYGHHGGAVQTAHVAWFRGIDNAPQVRELIQSRLRQWKDAGLGDHDDHSPEISAPGGAAVLAALRDVRAVAAALREAVGRSA